MDIWTVSSVGLFQVILKVLERVWKQEVLIFLAKTFLVEKGMCLDALDFTGENERAALKVADIR